MKRLVLYVGKHDPDETHQRRQDRCVPNVQFFRPLVNGMSFPDLKAIEVRHHWAVPPPANASLEIRDRFRPYALYQDIHETIEYADGLGRLESIVLESVPELNSTVLMQLVGNPKALASSLTVLDLRYCHVDEASLAQLLYHAPPQLKCLSLIRGLNATAGNNPHHQPNRLHNPRRLRFTHNAGLAAQGARTHLCPLLRDLGKRLERLDYGAGHVCRHLFFDEDELRSLQESGVVTTIGVAGGHSLEHSLDVHAIERIVHMTRHHKSRAAREARIEARVAEAQSSTQTQTYMASRKSAKDVRSEAMMIRREMEHVLDEEMAHRHRLVNQSSSPWSRRIIAWQGLCEDGDTWAEMKLAADLEERGVKWVLASQPPPSTYARHSHAIG